MNILIGSLVVWKITSMLMEYDGPLNIVRYFRTLANNFQDKHRKKVLNFECYFCLSTVVSLILAAFLFSGWDILYLGLAMSTISYVPYMVFELG